MKLWPKRLGMLVDQNDCQNEINRSDRADCMTMNDDSSLLGLAFAGGVITLNVLCVACCLALIYFKLRPAGSMTSPFAGGAWWFVVVVGAITALVLLALYLKGSSASTDRYTGIGLLASIPYFLPMVISGFVALFLKR
jgi:hypothetical protein